jgi:nitrate/TMAO reductase-like tetraheme cytochrome c subunit
VTPDRAALLRHPLALAGITLTTVAAVLFIALALAMLIGLLANPYAGLIVFVALPALFVIGLLLIPLGIRKQRLALAERRALEDWPVIDFRQPRTRRLVLVLASLTALNLIIVLVAGYGALHWMESPQFCGAVCHEPMHPQYTAWQDAPHSNVACVQCHIGEGGEAFVRYKAAGVRQLFHVVTNQYPRPIPGVADMRLAFETCGSCHWPGRSIGDRLRVLRSYGDDEANTESATALMLHLGGPGTPGGKGIHWHANPALRIEYVYTDEERQKIPWVQVTRPDGSSEEYVAEGLPRGQRPAGTERRMDCIDCHNVVAHRIEPSAEQAVDRALASGAMSRALPFVRRESVKLMQAKYDTTDAALAAIDQGLRGFYKSQSGQVDAAALERAVTTLKSVYQRNVFPGMNVTFGTYPDNLGHTSSVGCFRCHDGSLTAKDGTSIPSDCETCHKMLEGIPQ